MTFAHNIESFTGNRIAAGEPAALGAASAIPIPLAQLVVAALAGLVTAMGLGIPAGVVIGAAALILGQTSDRHVGVEPRTEAWCARPAQVPTPPVEAKT